MAQGQFLGYFRVPVGVPMVLLSRHPAEPGGDAAPAAPPAPEPVAVKVEPEGKERPKDKKGDRKEKDHPIDKKGDKKEKERPKDKKGDKTENEHSKDKRSDDKKGREKENKVKDPRRPEPRPDEGRVKKEKDQEKVKKEPTFEEEEDEEFLPAASAKSGAYKPYNDTWRDYEGRDQKLYPEEVRRRADGLKAKRTCRTLKRRAAPRRSRKGARAEEKRPELRKRNRPDLREAQTRGTSPATASAGVRRKSRARRPPSLLRRRRTDADTSPAHRPLHHCTMETRAPRRRVRTRTRDKYQLALQSLAAPASTGGPAKSTEQAGEQSLAGHTWQWTQVPPNLKARTARPWKVQGQGQGQRPAKAPPAST